MEDIEKLHGKDLAEQARSAALRLFARGSEVMRKRGLILIDTKYEFGVDEAGKLHVIDEVNTPDSSRLCDIEEWESKYPQDRRRDEERKVQDSNRLVEGEA